MNRYILKTIFKDFFSNKTQLFTTTLTYYILLSFIPSFILCSQLLNFLGLGTNKMVEMALGFKVFSPSIILSITIFSLFLIGRFFFIILGGISSSKPRILLSLFFGILTLLYLCLFILILSIIP